MKPTDEQVLQWAREAGIQFLTHEGVSGKLNTSTRGSQPIERIEAALALAYAAGAKEMQERAVKICESEASLEISNASAAYQQGREMGATVCGVYIRALGDDDE